MNAMRAPAAIAYTPVTPRATVALPPFAGSVLGTHNHLGRDRA